MATTLGAIRNSVRELVKEAFVLVTPGAPLISPQGTPGATTYTYKIVATNAVGHSAASVVGTTATGNAALSGSNYNQLTWTPVPYATGYDIYRTVGGATQGRIAQVGAVATTTDTGLAGNGVTAPTTNTSGTTGGYWNDTEILSHIINGARQLWRDIIDLHQDHFSTIDVTNVSLAASSGTLTGVPIDTFRVLLIQPRDTTDASSSRALTFTPARSNSIEFRHALSRSAIDPGSGGEIFYSIKNAGSPVAAPTIHVAPQILSAVNLRFEYIPTLSGSMTADTDNPIPGESDSALEAYGVAMTLAKEREDNSPDPNWIAKFSTEKGSILKALTPRQEQQARVVRGVFDDSFGPGLSTSDWY